MFILLVYLINIYEFHESNGRLVLFTYQCYFYLNCSKDTSKPDTSYELNLDRLFSGCCTYKIESFSGVDASSKP